MGNMGFIIGVALLAVTAIATMFVTWQSTDLDKELSQYQAEINKLKTQRDVLLMVWMANVAYWAAAALEGWVK